jgi:hypothetical protein
LKIFDFEAQEPTEESQEKDWLLPQVSYQPMSDEHKDKFSDDQLTIIFWARKVFLSAK